jgi:hypothetical protein
MAITRIGVQPVIVSAGQAAGTQTYCVGEVTPEGETVSLAVSCTNDLSVEGNCNFVHWAGEGASYQVYKAEGGAFGLIGTVAASPFIDVNSAPDMAHQPPAD